MTASELQVLLMERVEDVHAYVGRRIPTRFRATISADDLLQEVWIAAFRNVATFRADSADAFERWLAAIVRTKLVTAVRRAQRIKHGGRFAAADQSDPSSSYLGLLAKLSAGVRTPSSEGAAHEAIQAVQLAVGALPENYRTVISLRYLEGRTQGEVAASTKRTVGAVNSLLYRGMCMLRQRLTLCGRYFSDTD